MIHKSKALVKSQNSAPTANLLLSANKILFFKVKVDVSVVNLVLKPYCWSTEKRPTFQCKPWQIINDPY
jgi:hypothetical protein